MAVRRARLPAISGEREVSQEEARRIAVRAQLLDGTARGVLPTVRQLDFLQLDPIAPVLPAHELVLWSRLGPYDRAELDRLLWEERALFEWNAFVWPVEAARDRPQRPAARPGARGPLGRTTDGAPLVRVAACRDHARHPPPAR
jgi:hypothetical protein